MMYLTIIFASPLYFMIRKKWGAFMLNGILYSLAWLCLISILGAWIAPIFWALAVGHAGWHLRSEVMEQHATLMATKMAEKMVEAQQRGGSGPQAGGSQLDSLPAQQNAVTGASLAKAQAPGQSSAIVEAAGNNRVFCGSCGASQLPGARFCEDCGAAL